MPACASKQDVLELATLLYLNIKAEIQILDGIYC